MTSDRNGVIKAAKAIREYVARNPQAEDTIDGVQQSWLAECAISISPENVHCALEILVKEGVLASRRSPDGRAVYRKSCED